jgi:hypothetical protein
METGKSGWDSLPLIFKVLTVACHWRERPQRWYLLIPEDVAVQCMAFENRLKEKFSVSIGPLSLLSLLPVDWVAAVFLLIILKTKHSWSDLLRLIFWGCWFDPDCRGLSLRFRAICASIIGLSAGVFLAVYETFIWLFRGHV